MEKMLEFGRELFLLSKELRKELGRNETNKKMLKVYIQSNINHFNTMVYFLICIFYLFRMRLVY